MKKCPECGELLMDSTEICPVCGYKFETMDFKKRLEIERGGMEVPLSNGGMLRFKEDVFLEKYPPFLEGVLPALVLLIENTSGDSITLRITAKIDKYAQSDKKTISLKPGETYQYEYYPVFDRKSMGDLKSYGKSTLSYKIYGDTKQRIEKSESITILSYGDILWKVDGESLAGYIVKWVTPGEGVIREKLLNSVMNEMEKMKEYKDLMKSYGMSGKGGIYGMQLGKEGVYIQTWALYNALKRMGIRYKSTPVSILHGYQRVRLPKEVLKEKGGNCIDLAVTFASALEAMDMIPVILLTTSHAFPGVLIPKELVNDYRSGVRYKKDVFAEINRKYSGIMSKYTGKMGEEKDSISTLDSLLVPCCGHYLLPVESTMIPDSPFLAAVKSIVSSGTLEQVEELIIVPEVREELGDVVLPYENVKLTIVSTKKKFKGRRK